MSDQENGEANISDLAKSSGRKEAKSWLPAVPITVLAPILVALALTATLLPNTFVINQASQDSTTYISQKYLKLLMVKTKADAEAPLLKIEPVVNFLGESPRIVDMFSAPQPLVNLVNNVANNPGYNADIINTKGVYNVTTLDYAYFSWATPDQQVAWAMDPTTYLPITTRVDPTAANGYLQNPVMYQVSNIVPGPGLMQLGLIPPAQSPFFSVTEEGGLVVGYISQQFWAAGNDRSTTLPLFTCVGGLVVTTTWISMLHQAKPLDSAVVAMFNSSALGVLGSSNMLVQNTAIPQADGSVLYGQPIVDDLTAAFQVQMSKMYLAAFKCNEFIPYVAEATSIVQANPSYELSVAGTTWIVNVDIVLLGSNDYALLMLAVPRSELRPTDPPRAFHKVYGEIDRARTKAQRLSIGISCAMAFIVAGVFVLVVLPLMALVRQMTQLTKFDFGSLESSGALDKRSWVWELRQVQIVFSMMVKAFAGAIKKNKDMVASRQTPSGGHAKTGEKNRLVRATAPAMPSDQ
ncbi:hypothetical protein HDU88_005181 [Geranomyces variabilis]|nr:hypothetical protein HDU88_005181 [Geranomyces variabilis]